MSHFHTISTKIGLLRFNLIATSVAAIDVKCAKTDVCFGLGIPDITASAGDGDIYFRLTAPSSASWVSLGQGDQMDDANMFVVYTSSDGNNVTVSSRIGHGHRTPKLNSDAQLTLLDGSGLSDGIMTANVRCKTKS